MYTQKKNITHKKKINVNLNNKMKFKKTSSTITSADLSLNFNVNEISSILRESSLYDWELLTTCKTWFDWGIYKWESLFIWMYGTSWKNVFFSKREVNDKIVVGDGSEGDHFNVCMTSLALLKNLDGSNQNHICHYIADQFFRCDFNNIRFDSKNKKTGIPYIVILLGYVDQYSVVVQHF